MKNRLYAFFESIWLGKETINQIINNISWDLIEEEIVVKDAINYILENNEATNDEVEKKILNIDIISLMNKLNRLWAIKTFDWKIEDNRYDFSDMELKKDWMLLRIRKKGDSDLITLKRQVYDKTCNIGWCSKDYEFETKIEDIDKVLKSVHDLWLRVLEWKNYKKRRISYELDGVNFDFDEYDWRKWLLEIESDNEYIVNNWISKLWLENNKTSQHWLRILIEDNLLEKAA